MPKSGPHQPTRDLVTLNLRRLMDAKGVSRPTLAESAKVGAVTIYNIREGLSSANVDTLGRLADALEVEVIEFFRPTHPESFSLLNGS